MQDLKFQFWHLATFKGAQEYRASKRVLDKFVKKGGTSDSSEGTKWSKDPLDFQSINLASFRTCIGSLIPKSITGWEKILGPTEFLSGSSGIRKDSKKY